jgi:ferric-dicitrate binding protein FerR (iron transport regulator)
VITTQPASAENFSSASWADREKGALESERQRLLVKQQVAREAKEKAEAARQYAIKLDDQRALPVAEKAILIAEGALTRITASLGSGEQRLAAVQRIRTAGDDKPRAAASRLRGEVTIKTPEGWKTFGKHTLLGPGEVVRTGADGFAELMFNDGSRINLDANSSLMLESANGNTSTYRLTLGRIKAHVKRLGDRRYKVRTPTAICGVRGTEFVLETNEAGASAVVVLQGEVAFGAAESRQSLPVRSGELAILGPDGTFSGPDSIELKSLQN